MEHIFNKTFSNKLCKYFICGNKVNTTKVKIERLKLKSVFLKKKFIKTLILKGGFNLKGKFIKYDKKYNLFGYTILSFASLKNYKKFIILSFRNNKKIGNHMRNTDIIPVKKHVNFLMKLKKSVINY